MRRGAEEPSFHEGCTKPWHSRWRGKRFTRIDRGADRVAACRQFLHKSNQRCLILLRHNLALIGTVAKSCRYRTNKLLSTRYSCPRWQFSHRFPGLAVEKNVLLLGSQSDDPLVRAGGIPGPATRIMSDHGPTPAVGGPTLLGVSMMVLFRSDKPSLHEPKFVYHPFGIYSFTPI